MIVKKYESTELDYELMNWHDSLIHAISFGYRYELSLDIDYILQWEKNPENSSDNYKFWIAPATVIFENVHSLIFDIEISEPFSLDIDYIERRNPNMPKNYNYIKKMEYDWEIITQQGIISFKSVGFKQYIRRTPLLCDTQRLSMEERGGISFDTITSALVRVPTNQEKDKK